MGDGRRQHCRGELSNAARFATVLTLALALGSACRATHDAAPREIVTEVAALEPALAASDELEAFASAVSGPTFAGPCPDVQRQARELGSALPRRLDADTLATGVSAQGCDLVFEYELTTLDARDVAPDGMQAMSARVGDQLCSDRGALSVMRRGGRFTNVYYDRSRIRIGLFMVTADDCGI